jgi:hypothetical protein
MGGNEVKVQKFDQIVHCGNTKTAAYFETNLMPILGTNMSKFIPLLIYPSNRLRGVIYKISFQPDLTTHPPPNKEIISEKLLYKEGVYMSLFSTKKNGIILKKFRFGTIGQNCI